VLALVAAPPAGAIGEVEVELSGTTLLVRQEQPANTLASVGLDIRHFANTARNGIEVSSQAFLEPAPGVLTTDPDCQADSPRTVFCTPFPQAVILTTTNGFDFIRIGGSNAACTSTQGTRFEVDLGDNGDTLKVMPGCGGDPQAIGINLLHPRFDPARGGNGDDDLRGGQLNDTLSGGADEDSLLGGAGADTLLGGSANDTLEGDIGGDTLHGGTGTDILKAGAGNDEINSRDGVAESAGCGTGIDTVIADLQDTAPSAATDIGCENVQRFATDDGPPGRIVGRSVLVRRSGRLKLRLRCPRRAKVTCKGKLRLTHAGRRRTLASKRYRVRRGRTKTLRLKLSRRAARRARARRAIVVRTSERGVSKKGPRSTIKRLRVRRKS
jgi:hypothetical protein